MQSPRQGPTAVANYVIQGIQDGYMVGFDDAHHCTKRASSNMKLATEHATVVQEYLAKECPEGSVLGPVNMKQFPLSQVSKLGVIPKGSTGKWHLINHSTRSMTALIQNGTHLLGVLHVCHSGGCSKNYYPLGNLLSWQR